jgi:hypothetical protein
MTLASDLRTIAATAYTQAELDEKYYLIGQYIQREAADKKFTTEVGVTEEQRAVIETWLRDQGFRVYDGSAPGTEGVYLAIFELDETPENILVSWQGYEISVDRITAAVGVDTITYTITTQGVEDGVTIYWRTEGTCTVGDFTDGDLSAGVIVTANAAVITRTIDPGAVPGHTIIMEIFYDGLFVELLATADTVTIV